MIHRRTILAAAAAALDAALDGARQAVRYLTPTLTVKATCTHRPDHRARQQHFVMTIGVPNYRERAFIKTATKAGEPFPVRKVQLRHWPQKKSRKGGK